MDLLFREIASLIPETMAKKFREIRYAPFPKQHKSLNHLGLLYLHKNLMFGDNMVNVATPVPQLYIQFFFPQTRHQGKNTDVNH